MTTVYVTHDQTEAMTLGQRVAVMRDGKILQCDRPQQLYAQPSTVFIAAFIGSPAMNLVEATYDGTLLRFGQYSVPATAPQQERLILGIRPESFEDAQFAQRLCRRSTCASRWSRSSARTRISSSTSPRRR